MTSRKPSAPPSLSPAGRVLWNACVADYELGAGELQLLEAACVAWGNHQLSAAIVAKEGPVVDAPQGSKMHPGIAVCDRTAQLTAKLLHQLHIGLNPADAVKLKRGGAGRPAVTRPRRVA